MNFKTFLNESSNKPIKDALKLENPEMRKEYLKEIVLNNITLLRYAISLQKTNVLANIDKEDEQNVLEDLLTKTRKWENLFLSRWPEEKLEKDPNLSPKPAKPVQPLIDPAKPQPMDIQNQLLGNEDDKEEKPKK